MRTRVLGIIGGGTMGRGLAQLAVMQGFGCLLTNRSKDNQEQSRHLVLAGLAEAESRGKLSAEEVVEAEARLNITEDIEEVIETSDLIIDCIPEDLSLKISLFEKLSTQCRPETILATNTSSLSVSDISKNCSRPERVIGLHFFHPPVKMKLLEIVRTQWTSEATYKEARAVGEALGRTCIQVKDSPGFATSRLSVAVGLEAIRMLEEGVASAEDIDTAMEVGYRWPMGPLKLGDWVGLDVRLAVADELHDKLKSDTFQAPDLLRQLVADGQVGKKVGQGLHVWPKAE